MPFTIVGVEPRGFAGVNVGEASDVTVPLQAGERVDLTAGIWVDPFATWVEIMGRRRPDASLEAAVSNLSFLYGQVNASAASAAPQNAFAARVVREARLIVKSGARGGIEQSAEWVRALAAAPPDDARGGRAPREPECRHAPAVPGRSPLGRNRHAPRHRRGTLAHRAPTDDGIAADWRDAAAWLACSSLVGEPVPPPHRSRQPANLPLDLTPDLRMFGFTLVHQRGDVSVVRAAPGDSRHAHAALRPRPNARNCAATAARASPRRHPDRRCRSSCSCSPRSLCAA